MHTGKPRLYYLDAIRIIACIMVVFMHAPIPHPELRSSAIMGFTTYFTHPCIGLFFMVSGALLLPVKSKATTFLKKRASRILSPLIVWSLFYILIDHVYDGLSIEKCLQEITYIPFVPVMSVLWFLYTIIGLYLFAPIISGWLENATKPMLEYFLLFWLISMCIPLLKIYWNIADNDYNIVAPFTGFTGYMILGYYLSKYPVNIFSISKKSIAVWSLTVIFSLCVPSVLMSNAWGGESVRFNVMYNYLSISVVMMCIIWFSFVQYLYRRFDLSKLNGLVRELSVMSFGIYLVHIYIMRRVLWPIISGWHLSVAMEILVSAILSFGFSYLVVKLISRFPFGKYIIG